MPVPGLYEQVINEALAQDLAQDTAHLQQTAPIDSGEAAHVLAEYLTNRIEQGLTRIQEQGGGLQQQIAMTNRLLQTLVGAEGEEEVHALSVAKPGEQLLALVNRQNSIYALDNKAEIVRPQTSIAQSSLFTGALHEPQMLSELKREIVSADRIDFLVSFIKWSGLRLMLEELRQFTERGGQLRVLTTSYMGATEVKAIEALSSLMNTQIKVSYDTRRTRLHAKTYVFYRNSGFTTAYVGSSNLTNAAISSGLEWNLKVTRQDLPETIAKIDATFESYWNSSEFEYYDEGQRERLTRALQAEKYFDGPQDNPFVFDLTPYSYQREILDRLAAERQVRGRYQNLVVAATGTGKTVISAFDYQRWCRETPKTTHRLLFVAHREELLRQSLNTFRAVLKDPNFGELFNGNHRPQSVEHLFLSIQTFHSQHLAEKTAPDFYDFVVVDEFHHAASASYRSLLSYYRPQVLLGLTATPERMDGQDILGYFGGRIAAEIRLTEAIDRKLLCPFQYFGVTDTVDLDQLKWTRGGYDKRELSNIYTLSGAVAEKRADQIVHSLVKYVSDLREVKGLGFCVSVEHAAFMAEHFNRAGIPSLALTGETPADQRTQAQRRLTLGELRFLFVVDIYNEGVDIPQVNTILFLRPTESLTIFLQQLGRGLRLAEGKDCLTVLDFIGQAHRKYNFEQKFSALLHPDRKGMAAEIKSGFLSVPKGCYIQLEKQAQQHILQHIQRSLGRKSGLLSRIASFEEDSGLPLTLGNFLDYHHMAPAGLYGRGSFSRLCQQAGVGADFAEPAEKALTAALPRLALVDSRRWIAFLLDLLPRLDDVDFATLPPLEQRFLQMLYATIWGEGVADWEDEDVLGNLYSLSDSPTLLSEVLALLQYRYEHIDFLDEPVELGFQCPLDLHCTYTRDQIMVAMDFLKPSAMREGVKYLPDKKLDLFFITLNKADKDYSPTTMYQDYSINQNLFHWQSQSTTSEQAETGQRYIHHRDTGNRIALFVREWKRDPLTGGTAAYTFLGTASYVSHQGSRPMNIIWQLEKPIPAHLLRKTNKLVAG